MIRDLLAWLTPKTSPYLLTKLSGGSSSVYCGGGAGGRRYMYSMYACMYPSMYVSMYQECRLPAIVVLCVLLRGS